MTAKNSSYFLLKRLFKEYISPHKKRLILASILMIIVAIATALTAYMMKPVIDQVFISRNHNLLMIIAGIILTLFTVKSLSIYGYRILLNYVELNSINKLQQDLYKKLLSLDYHHFIDNSTGRTIAHFSNDITAIRYACSNFFINIVKESVTMIGLIILMFIQNFQLSLVAFFVFPAAIFPLVKIGKKLRKLSRMAQEEYESFIAQIDNSYKGIKVIKSYCSEDFEVSRFNRILQNVTNIYYKAAKKGAISSPLMELLGGSAVVAVIVYGGQQVISGTATAGSFFAFVTALLMAYKPLRSVSTLNSSIQSALSSLERVFTILDTPVRLQKSRAKLKEINKIEFQDVSFIYPNSTRGIKHLSFTAEKGQIIALVGRTGSGKSTMVNLLLRLFDFDQGKILVNDKDINQIDTKDLRKNIAVVFQDGFIFDDTILHNIAYAIERGQENKKKISSSVSASYADEVLERFDNNYDALLKSSGSELSGGQKQRINIARAIYKDAPVLIFDEATSALDNLTQAKIQKNLEALKKDKIIIVIAHRISNAVNADQILLFDDEGNIAAKGTHQELMASNAHYKAIVMAGEVLEG